MRKLLFLLILICGTKALHAQNPVIYTIRADSVKITNDCDTAELIIENHTQNVPGFLYNKGRGRTEFRRAVLALDDSLYLIGGDTLNINKGRSPITASNGLTMTDGDIKMGGELTEFATALKFNLALNGFGIFQVLSADQRSYFNIWNQDDGQFLIGGVCALGNKGSEFNFTEGGFGVSTQDGPVSSTFGLGTYGMILRNGNFLLNGNISAGGPVQNFVPTAKVHIGSGTTSAGTAPLKFTTGTLLNTPENGALEFNGTDLFFTENAIRYKLSKTLSGQLTTSFGSPSLAPWNAVTTTLSVAGAQPGDVVSVSANTGVVNPPSIVITAYVTSANTITLQAYNAGNSAVTLASDTYKVRVVK